jgi:hypothetical protein
MGVVFDTFLVITTAIEVHAFYHRVYLVALANHQSVVDYCPALWGHFPTLNGATPAILLEIANRPLDSSLWGVEGLDVSAIITIALMTIPIAVIMTLPLFAIRRLVREQQREAIARLQAGQPAAT